VSVTPLQLARLVALVANGGRLVRPHLARSAGGVPIPPEPPVDVGLKPATVALIRDGMKAVVAQGTGWRARLPGVAVGGKTGSAQVVARARLEKSPAAAEILPHGWFVAFAPVEEPRIALAILVEHGGSGGEAAAPVAQRVLAQFFHTGPPVAAPAGIIDTEGQEIP
jgi:penicillin-binding protein 2